MRENIIHAHSPTESTSTRCTATDTCMTKLIIPLTFLGIAQDFIRFGSLLEFFLRYLITRIFIGMILDGFLSVCFFDLISTC